MTAECPAKRPAPHPENLRHDPEHQRKAQLAQAKARDETPLARIARLQRLILAKSSGPEVSPTELTRLARAFKEQEELRRAILGMGDPKSVPARNDKPAGRRGALPATPTEPA